MAKSWDPQPLPARPGPGSGVVGWVSRLNLEMKLQLLQVDLSAEAVQPGLVRPRTLFFHCLGVASLPRGAVLWAPAVHSTKARLDSSTTLPTFTSVVMRQMGGWAGPSHSGCIPACHVGICSMWRWYMENKLLMTCVGQRRKSLHEGCHWCPPSSGAYGPSPAPPRPPTLSHVVASSPFIQTGNRSFLQLLLLPKSTTHCV